MSENCLAIPFHISDTVEFISVITWRSPKLFDFVCWASCSSPEWKFSSGHIIYSLNPGHGHIFLQQGGLSLDRRPALDRCFSWRQVCGDVQGMGRHDVIGQCISSGWPTGLFCRFVYRAKTGEWHFTAFRLLCKGMPGTRPTTKDREKGEHSAHHRLNSRKIPQNRPQTQQINGPSHSYSKVHIVNNQLVDEQVFNYIPQTMLQLTQSLGHIRKDLGELERLGESMPILVQPLLNEFMKSQFVQQCYQITGKIQLKIQHLKDFSFQENKLFNQFTDYQCELLNGVIAASNENTQLYGMNGVLRTQINQLVEEIRGYTADKRLQMAKLIEVGVHKIAELDSKILEQRQKIASYKAQILDQVDDRKSLLDSANIAEKDHAQVLMLILDRLAAEKELGDYVFTPQFCSDCSAYLDPQKRFIEIKQKVQMLERGSGREYWKIPNAKFDFRSKSTPVQRIRQQKAIQSTTSRPKYITFQCAHSPSFSQRKTPTANASRLFGVAASPNREHALYNSMKITDIGDIIQ